MHSEEIHNKVKLMVIDDEINICRSIYRLLKQTDYHVSTFQSGEAALKAFQQESFDLILTDLKMPEIDGIALLMLIKKIDEEVPVIIMTAYSTVDTAVEAIKKGAFDYISKPFKKEELFLRLEKALKNRAIMIENKLLKEELENRYKFKNIIGKSRKMQKIYNTIEKVACTDATVLICGESGTGKELIARAIHYNSNRKDNPFVYIDCSSIVESLLESELFGHEKGSFTGALNAKKGLFEAANGGTIFLDEIGNISLSIQAKLLRVLQEREIKPVGSNSTVKIDVRLITATNKNLEEMIKIGHFRDDLYYRLNVVPIKLPPLREREEDIFLLTNYFLQKYNNKMNKNIKKISSHALSILENYNWPGNVRELENIIERMVVMAETDVINVDQLPLPVRKFNNNRAGANIIKTPKTNEELKKMKKKIREEAVKNVEKAFLIEALKRNGWNITHAAKEVGMKRENFYALMGKCGIRVNRNLAIFKDKSG